MARTRDYFTPTCNPFDFAQQHFSKGTFLCGISSTYIINIFRFRLSLQSLHYYYPTELYSVIALTGSLKIYTEVSITLPRNIILILHRLSFTPYPYTQRNTSHPELRYSSLSPRSHHTLQHNQPEMAHRVMAPHATAALQKRPP